MKLNKLLLLFFIFNVAACGESNDSALDTPPVIKPRITYMYPKEIAKNTEIEEIQEKVAPDSALFFKFNKAIDISTVINMQSFKVIKRGAVDELVDTENNTYNEECIDGLLEWSEDKKVLSFIPDDGPEDPEDPEDDEKMTMEGKTLYTIVIDGVKDYQGEALDKKESIFVTKQHPELPSPIRINSDNALYAKYVDPYREYLVINFNEPVKIANSKRVLLEKYRINNNLEGYWSPTSIKCIVSDIENNSIRIYPEEPLIFGVQYKIYINEDAITDYAGQYMSHAIGEEQFELQDKVKEVHRECFTANGGSASEIVYSTLTLPNSRIMIAYKNVHTGQGEFAVYDNEGIKTGDTHIFYSDMVGRSIKMLNLNNGNFIIFFLCDDTDSENDLRAFLYDANMEKISEIALVDTDYNNTFDVVLLNNGNFVIYYGRYSVAGPYSVESIPYSGPRYAIFQEDGTEIIQQKYDGFSVLHAIPLNNGNFILSSESSSFWQTYSANGAIFSSCIHKIQNVEVSLFEQGGKIYDGNTFVDILLDEFGQLELGDDFFCDVSDHAEPGSNITVLDNGDILFTYSAYRTPGYDYDSEIGEFVVYDEQLLNPHTYVYHTINSGDSISGIETEVLENGSFAIYYDYYCSTDTANKYKNILIIYDSYYNKLATKKYESFSSPYKRKHILSSNNRIIILHKVKNNDTYSGKFEVLDLNGNKLADTMTFYEGNSDFDNASIKEIDKNTFIISYCETDSATGNFVIYSVE